MTYAQWQFLCVLFETHPLTIRRDLPQPFFRPLLTKWEKHDNQSHHGHAAGASIQLFQMIHNEVDPVSVLTDAAAATPSLPSSFFTMEKVASHSPLK